jgi:hypothetical protein
VGYYHGDHYRRYAGDYYRGDPSFLSGIGNFFKKVVGVVAPAAVGFLTGGPKGAIAGAVGGATATTAEGITQETLAAGGSESAYTPELQAQHALALQKQKLKGPTGLPALPPPGGGMAMVAMHGARRMHANKSTYVTRGGGTSRWPVGLTVHVKGTEAVPSRRMNVANPRALRRALRRAQGFAKLARRFIAVTHRFKKKGVRRRR